MKINRELTQEENRLLEQLGIVSEGGRAYFRKKEPAVPVGMRRLASGKIIPYKPIEDCLKR